MNFRKLRLGALIVLSQLLCTSQIFANTQPERYPNYPIAYEFANTDSIKDLLNKVRLYYQASSIQQIVDRKSGQPIVDLGISTKDAIVSPGFSSEWSYTNGVVLSAFSYIDDFIDSPEFFANNIKFFDFVVNSLPFFEKNESIGWREISAMEALDHCGSIGAAMVKTYMKTRNKEYVPLIQKVENHISNIQFRLDDGTLARHRPQYKSVWADDMYMSVPFLINMGKMSGETKYYDDAVRQILQMADRLYVPKMELFDHGWNVTSGDYDPYFFWGRANGWVLMSMAEVLDILPENYEGRDRILHLYRSMVRSLANYQDGTGFWHNLLDKNDTELETSCTAMFTYAIAKGINEGWISAVYGPVALTGWNATKSRILPNGAVDGTCEGTTFAHDNTYYYNRGCSIYATHGYGVVLYAGAEIMKLLQNDQIEILKVKNNSINSTFHFRLKSEWPNQK